MVKFATDISDRIRAVTALAGGLTRIADGDLGHRIEDTIAPAFEALRTDFNTAVDRIRENLLEVSARSEAIRSGTQEISTASDDLSRRTEQQAASLEETAAALDEITATVRKTAEGSSMLAPWWAPRRGVPRLRGRLSARLSRPCRASKRPRARSARSSGSSTRSRFRPTSSP